MPSRVRFDTGAIRALAAERVEASSLRAVAEEIGVSKSGLDSFLKGRDPYAKTRVKLAAWYEKERTAKGGGVAQKDVDAAIAVIERYVKGAGTAAGQEKRVREVAERLFGEDKIGRG